MCYFRISLQDNKVGVTEYFLKKAAFCAWQDWEPPSWSSKTCSLLSGLAAEGKRHRRPFPLPEKTLSGLLLLSRSCLPLLTDISPSSAISTLPLDLNQLHHSGLHTSYLTNQSPGLELLKMSAHTYPRWWCSESSGKVASEALNTARNRVHDPQCQVMVATPTVSFPPTPSLQFYLKWEKSEGCSVVSESLRPHGLQSPWNSLGQNTGVGSLSLTPGDLPKPGIEHRSPALQADSLSAEPQGKPKNTGVGSLSLLQGIFPTQESNRGILHCRQILYQLNYEGSPFT